LSLVEEAAFEKSDGEFEINFAVIEKAIEHALDDKDAEASDVSTHLRRESRKLAEKLQKRDAALRRAEDVIAEQTRRLDKKRETEAELKERDATIALERERCNLLVEQVTKHQEEIASLRLEVETLNVMLKELVAKDYDKILDYCDSGLQEELSDAKEKMGKIVGYARHREGCDVAVYSQDQDRFGKCECGLLQVLALYQERPAHPYDKDKKERPEENLRQIDRVWGDES
jgi:hypothetical protein